MNEKSICLNCVVNLEFLMCFCFEIVGICAILVTMHVLLSRGSPIICYLH